MSFDTLTAPTGRSIRVGLDVGGTKIEGVVVDDAGVILARRRAASGWGGDAVVEGVVQMVSALAEEASVAINEIDAVGIGIPGLVDADAGRVLHAVNLGVESLDLAALASARLGVPVWVENDVKAAALGASAMRGGTGSMAYLNLGTGVAAGVIVNGRIWRGSHGIAGEVGHISVDPRGRECGCGQRGCIETLCGGGALARAWGKPGELPIRDLFDAADAGDAFAQELRADLARGAAAAVRVLVLSTDVDTVVIGGGLTALADRFVEDILGSLRDDAATSPFLASLRLTDRLEIIPLGSPVAALGAALVGAHIPEKENATHG